jgi:hypothetical protein
MGPWGTGLQNGKFSNKQKDNFGIFLKVFELKSLVYFLVIWYFKVISVFHGHLSYFVFICYRYFFRFGVLHQDKSCNPAGESEGNKMFSMVKNGFAAILKCQSFFKCHGQRQIEFFL